MKVNKVLWSNWRTTVVGWLLAAFTAYPPLSEFVRGGHIDWRALGAAMLMGALGTISKDAKSDLTASDLTASDLTAAAAKDATVSAGSQ